MADEKPKWRPKRSRYRRYDGRVDEGVDAQSGAVDGLGTTQPPTRLSSSLERLVRNLGAPPISVLTQLESRWPDIVGPGLAASTRPVELVDGVLTVACEDSTWASQISWMEGQIKQRYAAVFADESDQGSVERVAVRVDR